MSPIQTPVCTRNAQIRANVGLNGTQFLHVDTFFRRGLPSDDDNSLTNRRVESVTKYKLPTYQAAAVVSTVLAGVESQFLVFFKSSPDFTQESKPAMLQYLLVLTYIALIFSVSATISSLVLTENFGNVPMLVSRFREKLKSITNPGFETASFLQSSFGDAIAPRRWRWIEWHWLFTLVISVLCLPAQILLYIWMQERDGIRVTVSVAGVFAMLPLLHFLPIPEDYGRSAFPPLLFPGWVGSPGASVLPVPVSFPQVTQTAPPASQIGF
ncbi:hypothetical protein B0F90DRAFT_1817817 [Multifurca ochricompacta]|uniref:Uncharacterized protein n=1 Tax=Multifurca ochricompacta TaxID=376703 RepID=A0AAD4QN07_9AGAM|nr:hypothetical protein B0F90DRAFT_1817817 [Multifurca ochricompacta]